jgi:hypothetical protein
VTPTLAYVRLAGNTERSGVARPAVQAHAGGAGAALRVAVSLMVVSSSWWH